MLIQEVTRLLPAPLPMPPQLYLTFSSSYLFHADNNVQNGYFVLHLLPRGPLLCARPILGLGLREESCMASVPGEWPGEEAKHSQTEWGILCASCRDIQSPQGLGDVSWEG